MAPRRLVSFVHVAGKVYGPGDDVPSEVADAITNPKAWGEQPTAEGEESDADQEQKAPAKKAAARRRA